jgi:hypothetical protein
MGDKVRFEVLEDVDAKNIVGANYLVIERGALAIGTITNVEQDKHQRGGDRQLGATIDNVRLADGEMIALSFNNGEPIILYMNIKDKTIYPAGREYDAYTYGRADLDSSNFDPR